MVAGAVLHHLRSSILAPVIGNPWPGVQSPADHHRCIEGRSQASVARERQFQRLGLKLITAQTEGDTAFEPRSRRPHTRPAATAATTVDLVMRAPPTTHRAGPRCRRRHDRLAPRAPTPPPSPTTIYRIMHHHGLVTASRRRNRSPPIRFQAEANLASRLHPPPPHGMGAKLGLEILHLGSTTTPATPSRSPPTSRHRPDRGHHLPTAIAEHGIPFSTLTDNGMVFTTFAHGGRTSASASRTSW